MRRRDAHLTPLLLTALGGCRARGGTGDGVLRFGLADAPGNLDPRLATDATSERVNRLLYSRLVDLGDQGLPVTGIADWEELDEAPAG